MCIDAKVVNSVVEPGFRALLVARRTADSQTRGRLICWIQSSISDLFNCFRLAVDVFKALLNPAAILRFFMRYELVCKGGEDVPRTRIERLKDFYVCKIGKEQL